MRIFWILLMAVSLLCLWQCSPSPGYIEQVNTEDYWPDTIVSLTVEESRQRDKLMVEDVIRKTVGKKIPPLPVTTLSGQTMVLSDILVEKSILITCDAHCGWSSEHATNDFRKALKKLHDHGIRPVVICLLMQSDHDTMYPEKFNALQDELRPLYQNIYIISDSNARRMNILGGSTRLVVDEEQLVMNAGFGVSLTDEDRIFNELYPFFSSAGR